MITMKRRKMEKMKRRRRRKTMKMARMRKKKIRGVMTSDSERLLFATRPHRMVLLLFNLIFVLTADIETLKNYN